jgi:hypothetical protein
MILDSLFGAIKSVFDFLTQKDKQKNEADVKAAAIKKNEQALVDNAVKIVEDDDLDEIRKRVSKQ